MGVTMAPFKRLVLFILLSSCVDAKTSFQTARGYTHEARSSFSRMTQVYPPKSFRFRGVPVGSSQRYPKLRPFAQNKLPETKERVVLDRTSEPPKRDLFIPVVVGISFLGYALVGVLGALEIIDFDAIFSSLS
ncbi:hypothetical protein AAMO2058_000070600 [Amorphochlora amoebiformis]